MPALPAIVLVNVLVLAPIALLCIFGIAERIGGRVFGYWATLCWIVVPLIGIKYTDLGYHQMYTEVTLPQSYGLTAMADFPSMVARARLGLLHVPDPRPDGLDRRASPRGSPPGVAIGIKPANSVFLLGPILALAYRRRWLGARVHVVAGLLPAVLTLALWKYRGLGDLPLFSLGAEKRPWRSAPAHRSSRSTRSIKYVQFNWVQLNKPPRNQGALLEHARRRVARARRPRRNPPPFVHAAFLLVGGWFAAFIVTKGTYPQAGIPGGSLFRIMMPAFPAFILGLASLVYLWPRGRRQWAETPPTRSAFRPRTRFALLGAAAVVFALSPFVVIAAAEPLHGPNPRAYEVDVLIRTVDPALRLTADVVGDRVLLRWNASQPSAAKVGYHIWRSGSPDGGAVCTPVPGGSDNCTLTMRDLGSPRGSGWVDRPGKGTWTYRLGLSASWLATPDTGDVYSVGPPVRVRVP